MFSGGSADERGANEMMFVPVAESPSQLLPNEKLRVPSEAATDLWNN